MKHRVALVLEMVISLSRGGHAVVARGEAFAKLLAPAELSILDETIARLAALVGHGPGRGQ